MGHVAFSDFEVLKEFFGYEVRARRDSRTSSTKQPGAEGLLNVVEDALVEQKVMQRWPDVTSTNRKPLGVLCPL